MQKIEDLIARVRGTAYESNKSMHDVFDDQSASTDTMHCAELVSETLKELDLISKRLLGGRCPPSAYTEGPYGKVVLKRGSYGPMEIIKAENEFSSNLAQELGL